MSQNILTDVDARLNAQLARPQLSSDGGIRHFLGVEGLNRAQLESIIDKAMGYFDANDKLINTDELSGRTVMNLFLKIRRARARLLRRHKSAWVPMC